MNREGLHKEIVKKLHKLRHYARLITEAQREEDIHQFRVNYKKLRALLRMLHHNKARLPKCFKRLYTAAGSIRDLQLHYQTLSTYFGQQNTLPVIYMSHILQATTDACTQFDRLYKHCSFSRLMHVINTHIPHSYHKKLGHWQEDNLQAIALRLSHELCDEDIHDIRKHVKDLLYTQQYLHLKKDYNPIAQTIGNYIDHCVLLQLLDVYSPQAPANEQDLLKQACLHWQKEKALLKAALINTVRL